MNKPRDIPELYLNREIGQLAFNRRVLAQAENRAIPLLERLRYLCIVSSNLDEFFEIRVSGLQAEIEAGATVIGPDRMDARLVFGQVAKEAHELVAVQYQLLNQEILPGLAAEGIRFLRRSDFTPEQAEWIKAYFFREVMPLLTPIGLDTAHPFPRVLNKSLNFAIELEGKDAFGRNSGIAIVQAPRVLPRVIRLPRDISDVEYEFVFLSSILHVHVAELFAGMKVVDSYQFRVTRNSELFVDEEEVKDLRTALRGELPHRQFGDEVRLEVADNCPPQITEYLLAQFNLGEEDLYRVDGPVNLVRLISVPDGVERPGLKFPAFRPGLPAQLHRSGDVFTAIREGDILLHHPYQSFQPVITFLEQAARDPAVAAIKMTVYRTGAESELMEILIGAARSGKEVTVVLELLARFDEETNINWAQRLEEVGAHIVYGVVGHKTHAKMLMVVRREEERLKRYVHLSTGNYHPRTTKLYTDWGLFTANEEIWRGRERRLHPVDRARARVPSEAPVAGAVHPPQADPARDPQRDPERPEREEGPHHRQDERPARAGNHRRPLRGFQGGSRNRPHRTRGVRAEARHTRHFGEYPRALGGRPLSRALARVLLPQ